jgi:hypothetical protein
MTPYGDRLVVCGPPGCGTASFVAHYRQPGDIVWDFDVIAGALAQCPDWPRPHMAAAACFAMRDGLFRWLSSREGQLARVLVVVTHPTQAHAIAAEIGATVVHLDNEQARVVTRAESRGLEWAGPHGRQKGDTTRAPHDPKSPPPFASTARSRKLARG